MNTLEFLQNSALVFSYKGKEKRAYTLSDAITALSFTLSSPLVTQSKVVTNATERLGLSLENSVGFAVVDADTGKTWMLVANGNPATSGDWLQLGDRDIQWGDVGGKPSTFTPSSHTHTASEIADSTAGGRSLLTAADAAAQRSALGLGTAATADAGDFTASVVPGVFASDLDALKAGVSQNAIYRKASGVISWRLPVAERIAFMGDSITAQGSAGTYSMTDQGYQSWARIFGGSQWDAALNGSVLEFATSGYTSEQIRTTHLPQVLASNATRCVIECGTNDYSIYTSAQAATSIRTLWSEVAAEGITPIATTITPRTTDSERQAWIAATNILIRAHAAADGVLLCDWAPLLETSAGVGNAAYFYDGVHPNLLGAAIMGRALKSTLSSITMDTRENYSASDVWLTRNVPLAGSGGQPTSWSNPTIASGGALNSKTLVASDDGNWWRIDYTNGSATSRSTLSNMDTNTTTVVGKTVEGVVELQVISGGLRGFQFRALTTGGTQEAYDLQTSDNVATADLITSADGVVVLRTPPTVVSGGVTLLWPQIAFSGTAVFQIRRVGIREVSP